MIVHKCTQGTDDWLKLRLGKFGSTDAQAVQANGKGLETLCFQKASELLIGKLPEQYTNEHIERGKELEASARLLYELETGNQVVEVGYVEMDEHLGCSPDGLVGDDGLVEIKCPSDRVFVEYLYSEKIDTKYMHQMQWQMWITDRKWCDYVVYNSNLDKIKIKRVERDDKAKNKFVKGAYEGIEKVKEILGKVQ